MENKTLHGYYAFQWKASSRIQLIITQGKMVDQQANISLAIYNKLKIFPTFLTLKKGDVELFLFVALIVSAFYS
jgi:hypothetical protein